jgi:adenosylhomocysteinase
VTEVDHFRALQAIFDGFRVMPMEDAAALGDIFVTVTGNTRVLRTEHIAAMKDGVVLANAGHFDVEIDMKALRRAKKRNVRPSLDEYRIAGKRIYVVGEGRLANLAAAEGHPSTVMSLSFCGQALATEYIVNHRGKLPARVITLPEEIDNEIARLQLEIMGVNIDTMTEEQKAYLSSWQHGT